MFKSYRIKANPGADKNIRLKIDQDFDLIEILSLKLKQEDLYTKFCADYGVVAGRVIANGGYGVPNVSISVFVPLSTEDEVDPIISTLYPYKTISDKNEDGYRYNLLPYIQEYGGHTPTGTFPDRNDLLTRTEVLEIYEKYYKFTVRTNDSGDFMIVGVPLGMQTVVMDLDLSNIGCFSQRPSDLIRMGLGVEGQFAGSQFRANSNLAMLPQIVNLAKEIEVDPFWGDDEFCTIGITRVDFDLRDSGIEILPQVIFMGSIFSNSDQDELKVSCKPSLNTGALCDMVTQSGKILAIRQTIYSDSLGFPVLEEYKFEDGGNIIDDNGTWLAEVPMNLDYITTNEFGEQILSNDPTIGIPTKGKYRFRIQYQNEDIQGSNVIRADYLVPNLKEYGWSTNSLNEPDNEDLQKKSYAFSLDWNDYGDTGTTLGLQIIQEAVDCDDKFFEFNYNRVYTVSGHIDRWKWGYLPSRILGIKEITERACTATTNRFPTNDAQFKFDIIFFVVYFTLGLFYPLIYVFIVVLHVLAWLYDITVRLWNKLADFWNDNIVRLCYQINDVLDTFNWTGFNCDNWLLEYMNPQNPFARYSLPMISYPDCDNCSCEVLTITDELIDLYQDNGNFSPLIDSNSVRTFSNYEENYLANLIRSYDPNPGSSDNNYDFTDETLNAAIGQGFAGYVGDKSNDKYKLYKTPVVTYPTQFSPSGVLSFTVPWSQRLNMMNSRDTYFTSAQMVTTVKNLHPVTNLETPSVPFTDQPLILVCDQGTISNIGSPGTLLSFTKIEDIYDPNITGNTVNQFGTVSITGNSTSNATNLVTRTVSYLNQNGTQSTSQIYLKLTQQGKSYDYKAGVEYFQMITGGTMSQLEGLIDFSSYGLLQNFVYEHGMKFRWGRGLAITNQQPFGLGFNATVGDMVYDSQGRLYCVGGFTSYGGTPTNGYIVRLLLNGDIDTSFNVGGSGFNSQALAIDIQSDGKLIIGGDFTSYNGVTNNRIIRLNQNGTPDGSFVTGAGFDDTVWKIKIQPFDGKVLVGGDFNNYNGGVTKKLARLTTLGVNDVLLIGNGFNNRVYDISLQTDNKILVAGMFTLFNSASRLYAVRLNTTGTLDSTFSTVNPLNPNPILNINDQVLTITQAVDGSGDIYMGGEFTKYQLADVGGIVKTTSTGIRIASFNNVTTNGIYKDFEGGPVVTIHNYLDANGVEKLLVGGGFNIYVNNNGYGNPAYQLVRLLNTGQRDTTFNTSQSWPTVAGAGTVVTTIIRSSVAPYKVTVCGSFNHPTVGERIKRMLDNGDDDITITSTFSFPTGPYNPTNQPGGWYNVDRTFNATPRNIVRYFDDKEIIFLTRGVDPYTEKQRIEYDLSDYFGQPVNSVKILGDYYLNVPVQPNTGYLTTTQTWQVPGVTNQTWRNNNLTPESHLVINNSNPRLFHFPFCSPVISIPILNQTNYIPIFTNFTAFTNNSLKYYSSLDKSESAFVSYNGDSFNVSSFTTPAGVSSPLKWDWSQGNNTIAQTWFVGDPPQTLNDNVITTSSLPIGTIEGSTLVASNTRTGQLFNINVSSQIFARVYSPAYHLNLTYNYDCEINNPGRLVFRSDRLPTSTQTQVSGNSSYAMYFNDNFQMYKVLKGGITTAINFSPYTPLNIGVSQDFQDRPSGSTVSDLVINSLSCEGMTLLSCYSGNGDTFGVVAPCSNNYDGNLEKQIVVGGCYYFVSKEYLSNEELEKDANNLAEWKARFIFSFAACREIFSHTFQNNWVNGGLYTFAFQKRVIFDQNNQPIYKFCGAKDSANAPYQGPVYYASGTSNSFFYRSTPYDHIESRFVGQLPRKKSWLTGTWESADEYEGLNNRNIFFPTTIMDLGPRDQFAKEVCFNPQLDGYLVETLSTTTFNPTDTILLFFFLSRLLSTSTSDLYLGEGNASVFALFSRSGLRIDGDVAQMFSINSEYGILPFNDQFYDDNDVYLSTSNGNAVIGVLYESDIEKRRQLTPGIITFGNVLQFNGYPKTQNVPMYQWIQPNPSATNASILGDQNNNWYTSLGGIYETKYQEMSFITTEYFQATNGQNTGYIYNYDNNGIPTFDPSTLQTNPYFVVSAPYHFYFGLFKGKSSLNRYIKKYVVGQI